MDLAINVIALVVAALSLAAAVLALTAAMVKDLSAARGPRSGRKKNHRR